MKAILFDVDVFRYVLAKAAGRIDRRLHYALPGISVLRYAEIPPPRLPGPDWVRVRTRYGGICGSDLNLIHLKDSPATSPFVSMPFVIGHEQAGVVAEVGPAVTGLRPGDRVTVDPLLPCAVRGIDPPCRNCGAGEYARCENFAEGRLAPGLLIGACRDTGGSWGEEFVAHQSQVFPVPDAVGDEEALFTEPLAVALQPILRDPPAPGERVLVIGAGLIGLMVVAALRALDHGCDITVLGRYPFQGEAAARMGADRVVTARPGYEDRLAAMVGARLYRPLIGRRVPAGGFDRVFDCVGSARSLDDALRLCRAGGTVVLVGLAAMPKGIDWTFVWLKELTVRGTFAYGAALGPDRTAPAAGRAARAEDRAGPMAAGTTRARTFAVALQLIATGRVRPAPLLTHVFPLSRYREALEVAGAKGRYRSIKVALRPE